VIKKMGSEKTTGCGTGCGGKNGIGVRKWAMQKKMGCEKKNGD